MSETGKTPPRFVTEDLVPPFPPLANFMADLVTTLGLPEGITYSRGVLLDEVASLRKRAEAPRAEDFVFSIPGPGASLEECGKALTVLRREVPFPLPFEANSNVRRACAALLEGLATGRHVSTDKVCILRRDQAARIVRMFKDAGWTGVWAGGVDNSYPNVGENEIWTVESPHSEPPP